MKISSGIVIIWHNKILLCHPTNSLQTNSYSIPKGSVDNEETIIDAAIRETREEVGIFVNKNNISNVNNPLEILYINKKGIYYKKVYVFIVRIDSLSELNISDEIIPRDKLQLSEVDWAGFMDKSQAETKIFYRFNLLLDLLK